MFFQYLRGALLVFFAVFFLRHTFKPRQYRKRDDGEHRCREGKDKQTESCRHTNSRRDPNAGRRREFRLSISMEYGESGADESNSDDDGTRDLERIKGGKE